MSVGSTKPLEQVEVDLEKFPNLKNDSQVRATLGNRMFDVSNLKNAISKAKKYAFFGGTVAVVATAITLGALMGPFIAIVGAGVVFWGSFTVSSIVVLNKREMKILNSANPFYERIFEDLRANNIPFRAKEEKEFESIINSNQINEYKALAEGYKKDLEEPHLKMEWK